MWDLTASSSVTDLAGLVVATGVVDAEVELVKSEVRMINDSTHESGSLCWEIVSFRHNYRYQGLGNRLTSTLEGAASCTLPGTEDWVAWDAPWPCSLVDPRLDMMMFGLLMVV